ncbi:T-complex protein 1 subunit gamma-like [Centruroides sculpturatus]|uniref:T-complex protein 1 subunit gamma-like n=1 Tax=Centruroides sculpturatus TaxID=218467 RepID=UPI000C6D5986|nr:T-complex protein 1 subunit gamma-like [Centruroides sculpturatus]
MESAHVACPTDGFPNCSDSPCIGILATYCYSFRFTSIFGLRYRCTQKRELVVKKMIGFGGSPILVLSQNTHRESGKKVQSENVQAAKAVADVIRTCLGPRAMLKMLMDPMGGIVMTNDGNAILREITVQHPAAKSMIEISRTQDEEVGDGTTSVIILGKFIIFYSIPVDMNNEKQMIDIVKSCIGTKFIGKWGEMACKIALDAVKTVHIDENGRKEIDIKRYAKVEKVPGGSIEESCVLKGVMLNKDITHPKMRRRIENPRIVLLDCPLEYKKGESQTNIEITKEEDFTRILELEEQYIQQLCSDVVALKPDLVITEKGISDLAQHYFIKANISAIRRVRKSDNNRIARACGATIVNRTDELKEDDVGTNAGLFEIKKIGDEYFCFITECKDPKACTIVLRGASKDVLNEVERNIQDAMCVTRNVMLDPYLVPGGGAVEMSVAQILKEKAKTITSVQQWPYQAVARALEVIPRTLIQNCGGHTIRTLTALRAKHATPGNSNWGINGETGKLADMTTLGIWEPLAVKLQTYKTAIETAVLLLRIDDIVSGSKKYKDKDDVPAAAAPTEESMKD